MNELVVMLFAGVCAVRGGVTLMMVARWAWKAVRRWRERREQAWVRMIHVSPRTLWNECRDYWMLTPATVALTNGLRSVAGEIQIQRWLLRDIKALGAQGAWDKHSKAANQMATGYSNRYTFGFVGPRATWPPLPVSSATTSYTLDFINRSLGLPAGDTQLKRVVYDCSVCGYDLNQCLTYCRAYLGAFTAPSQGTIPIQQSAQPLGQAAAATAITPPRRPDPVNDPFLAANDFAEELGRWLKLDDKAVAALPVRAYMLWVAIRAAQKDGAPWHDMDAALHDMAGVEYVVPLTPLAAAEGALAIAEWATHDGGSDSFTLYMREDISYVITRQMISELGHRANWLIPLLARAPVITATWDLDRDGLILSDGKSRRIYDHAALRRGCVPDQKLLAEIWAVARPL